MRANRSETASSNHNHIDAIFLGRFDDQLADVGARPDDPLIVLDLHESMNSSFNEGTLHNEECAAYS